MRNKRLLYLLGATILSSSMFVSCGTPNEQPQTNTEQNQVVTLDSYSEEGMEILKNNYVNTDDMKFALRNIGLDISNMKFKTYDENEIKLSDYIGRNVILEVAQAECNSCKASAPKVREALKDKDIELIPLFLNSTNEQIDQFYSSVGIDKDKTIIVDKDKISKEKLGLTKTPTYIFIDKTGKISLVKERFTDDVMFKEDLNLAFGEKKLYEYMVKK